MSNELFDLCKQVYEKTGWNDGLMHIYGDLEPKIKGFHRPIVGYEYTSDYLLEKLPDTYALAWHDFPDIDSGEGIVKQGREYYVIDTTCDDESFTYGERISYGDKESHYSDSPLKALLRLTLALSEAGEK